MNRTTLITLMMLSLLLVLPGQVAADGGHGPTVEHTTEDPDASGEDPEENETIPEDLHVGFEADDSGPIGYMNVTATAVPGENSTDLDGHLVLTLQGETGVPDVDDAADEATQGTPLEEALELGTTVQVDAEASLPGTGGL